MNDQPIDTFRWRFREYVNHLTGQDWHTYNASFSPLSSLEDEPRVE
jgi:hypothetical protein